jgi:hypothetical protein
LSTIVGKLADNYQQPTSTQQKTEQIRMKQEKECGDLQKKAIRNPDSLYLL